MAERLRLETPPVQGAHVQRRAEPGRLTPAQLKAYLAGTLGSPLVGGELSVPLVGGELELGGELAPRSMPDWNARIRYLRSF